VNRLVAAARRLALEAERCGGDWREAVTHLRRQAPQLWAGLPSAQRSRFLRHVRTYWDIHRHRVPASVLATLDEARAQGRLFVHAGRLQTLDATADGVRAAWLARGSRLRHALDVTEVVDCSGPDYDIGRSPERLWRSLLAKGLAVPDELRLGIRTGPNGALMRRDGSISGRMFYIGPMLRADHWEATAVGELRTHAEQLAARLLGPGQA
jgi:uncharacterized NAD(P)/FAD-binding protein YdhS